MEYKKYSGAGNTFLMVNNIAGDITNYREIVSDLTEIKDNGISVKHLRF